MEDEEESSMQSSDNDLQWERYRDIICKLYKEKKLARVMVEMERQHGFVATEKQYKYRLGKWGESKNLKHYEKDAMLHRQEEDYSSTEIAKLKRYLSTIERRNRIRRKSEHPVNNGERLSRIQKRPLQRDQTSHRNLHQHGDATDAVHVTNPDSPTIVSYGVTYKHKLPSLENSSPASLFGARPVAGASKPSDEASPQYDATYSTTSSLPSDVESIILYPALLSMAGDKEKIARLTRNVCSVSATSSSYMWSSRKIGSSQEDQSPSGQGLSILRSNIRTYCQYYATILADDPIGGRQSQLMLEGQAKKFWDDIKYAVWLFKESSFEKAEKAVVRALQEAPSALSVCSYNCVRELFTTLSPVNMSVCPDVRHRLLKRFREVTSGGLDDTHCLRVIVEQLSNDNDSQFVSQEAMAYMVDQTRETFGPSHTVTFYVQLAFTKMLRRSREYKIAGQQGQELLHFCVECSSPGSIWSRSAARELSHVLMDLGHHEEAIALSEDVVGFVKQENVFGNTGYIWDTRTAVIGHTDENAVWSMEDMAKSYDKLGDFPKSAFWLELAVEYAWKLWTNWVATEAIVDKLERVLKACGRGNEGIAEKWRAKCNGSSTEP